MDEWESKRKEALKQVRDVISRHAKKLEAITVVGSAQPDHGNRPEAEQVGKLVGELGFHLVTGGRGGAMFDVTEGFRRSEHVGLSIGVIPLCKKPVAKSDEIIFTKLPGKFPGDPADPSSRNHVNALAGQKMIVLPGGDGTCSEASLAIKYGKPVLAFQPNPKPQENTWLQWMKRSGITVVDGIDEVEEFLRRPVS